MNNNKTNKNNSTKIYTGKLSYNEQANYTLYSSISGTTNISDILYNICYSSNNYIEIKIMKGCKILFNESGRLLNKIDNKNGLLSYHVNSEDLESVLFFNTNEYLDIEIFSEVLLNEIDGKQGDNDLDRLGVVAFETKHIK